MAEILLPPTDGDSMETPPVFDTDEKKKRNRDVLSPNSIDLRFLGPSQKKLFYQARNTTIEAILSNHYKAKHAISKYLYGTTAPNDVPDETLDIEQPSEEGQIEKVSAKVANIRRKAIEFLFVHVFNKPLREDWKKVKLLSTIMFRLKIPRKSRCL